MFLTPWKNWRGRSTKTALALPGFTVLHHSTGQLCWTRVKDHLSTSLQTPDSSQFSTIPTESHREIQVLYCQHHHLQGLEITIPPPNSPPQPCSPQLISDFFFKYPSPSLKPLEEGIIGNKHETWTTPKL